MKKEVGFDFDFEFAYFFENEPKVEKLFDKFNLVRLFDFWKYCYDKNQKLY